MAAAVIMRNRHEKAYGIDVAESSTPTKLEQFPLAGSVARTLLDQGLAAPKASYKGMAIPGKHGPCPEFQARQPERLRKTFSQRPGKPHFHWHDPASGNCWQRFNMRL